MTQCIICDTPIRGKQKASDGRVIAEAQRYRVVNIVKGTTDEKGKVAIPQNIYAHQDCLEKKVQEFRSTH